MSDNKKYRHEYKYLISTEQVEELKVILGGLMRIDPHATGGFYTIRSLYFDDYDNHCYYDNENGISPREKCRIRIYNASDDTISLEWKRRELDRILKSSCPISREDVETLIIGKTLSYKDEMHPLMKKLFIMQETALLTPKVMVEYDRIPYIFPEGNVRVTIDTGIRAGMNISTFFEDRIEASPILPLGYHMLEVKFDEVLPDPIHNIIDDGRFKQVTFSKYYYCRKQGGI